MVGLTPTELESLNELIHIDHIYVKQQPQEPEIVESSFVEVQSDNAHELENKMETCIDEDAQILSSLPESYQTVVVQNLPESVNSVFINSPSSQSDDSQLNFSECEEFDFLSNSNEMLNALSNSGVEAPISLDFFDHLNLETAKDDDRQILTLPVPNSIHKLNVKQEPIFDNPEIFDDLENFLNFDLDNSDAASPLSSTNNDTDLFSEAPGVLSPSSSEGSFFDEITWHEPFSDLFPDLNKI